MRAKVITIPAMLPRRASGIVIKRKTAAPPGPLQLLGVKGILNQNCKPEESAGGRIVAPYTDLSNPTRKVHAKDLIETANKQRKR